MKIKLYNVCARGRNFGDSINPIVFERLFGLQTEHAYPTFCDVLGIGSIMQMLTLQELLKKKKYFYFYRYSLKPVITMGTGFMFDNIPQGLLSKTYRAVYPYLLRGKLSHSVLEKINKKQYTDVSYGDLGLIFPYLLDESISKKYSLGIFPHMRDFENIYVQKLYKNNKNAIIINSQDDPLVILRQISECETIVSSSLHGLVAADGLNIPNKRIKLSNHGYSNNIDFKFNDYYSIYSSDVPEYIDFTNIDIEAEPPFELLTPQSIQDDYRINFEEVKNVQNMLLKKGTDLAKVIETVRNP